MGGGGGTRTSDGRGGMHEPPQTTITDRTSGTDLRQNEAAEVADGRERGRGSTAATAAEDGSGSGPEPSPKPSSRGSCRGRPPTDDEAKIQSKSRQRMRDGKPAAGRRGSWRCGTGVKWTVAVLPTAAAAAQEGLPRLMPCETDPRANCP